MTVRVKVRVRVRVRGCFASLPIQGLSADILSEEVG